eukprot:gene3196-3474_t
MSSDTAKVVIVFQAAGGAPLLKQDKAKISVDSKFSKVVAFLRKQLQSDSVFVYLRNAFCPALDEELGVLTKAYGIDGKLHFYECVGVLQRDAPPVPVSGEQLIAVAPAAGFNLQDTVKRMAVEIREQIQVTEQLIQLLPAGMGMKPDQEAVFGAEQAQHSAVATVSDAACAKGFEQE